MDDSFSDNQFKLDSYQFPPFRMDRNKFGGRKTVYVKDDLVVKRLNDFETNISVTISLELTISNKNYLQSLHTDLQLKVTRLHFSMKFPAPFIKQ